MAVIVKFWIFFLCINNIQSYNELVIPGKTQAESSSVYGHTYFPSKTVDGDFEQHISHCSHTQNEKSITEAWLRINLLKPYSIKQIKFWYRGDGSPYANTKRLRGYSIRVSNDSDVPAMTCYTDTGNVLLPTIIENECVATSQYVWFYQTHTASGDNSPILEICEVQIFGCDTGRFGVNCSRTCDHCKNKATCGIEHGECDDYGCAVPGLQPSLCEVQCSSGTYGYNCSKSCGHCFGTSECDPIDGRCIKGCEPGWQPTPQCDIACSRGTYGKDCMYKCSGNCRNREPCNTVDGRCTQCMAGWESEFCNKKCTPGTYGLNCAESCGHCLGTSECDPIDGRCINGCEPGWQTTDKCDNKCTPGTYGLNCAESCGHCLGTSECDPIDGRCINGCEPGWQPTPQCDKNCPDGTFGKGCMYNCSGNCLDREHCNKLDGRCTQCMPGWMNKYCNKTCENGWHGPVCKNPCGHCFGSDVCHHINGSCPGNCSDGYTGETCTEACDNGKYGPACQNKCGHCFGTGICFHTNGSCPGNCSDGFTGDTCSETCKPGWFGPDCNASCGHCAMHDACFNTNGTCPNNCTDGYTGDKCVDTCPERWYGPGCMIECGFCNGSDVCFNTNGSCPGICSDGYSGETCMNKLEKLSSPEDIPVEVITIPLMITLFVFVAAILLFIFIRRRGADCRQKQLEQFSMKHVLLHAEEHNYTEGEDKEEHEPEPEYYNTFEIKTKHLRIEDILTTIQTLEKDNNKEFEKEFKSIPYGERPDISCTVGKAPDNTQKNRFKEIFPYDHSRVVLSSKQNRDYINASFIKNTYGKITYIATQAPKLSTVGDFWQMIWQEDVEVIAMVTNLTEGTNNKSALYWPESISKKLVKGKFIVRLVNEKTYANFAVRQMKIDNKETKTNRHVTQLQFTAWPDHGTPHPVDLLVFYHYVSREVDKNPESKFVVHCSAGVGRTGTFIALDALYRQGMKEGKINIVEYVNTMREDRMNMIQNFNQYKFLYKVLYECFRSGCHFIEKREFVTQMASEMSPNKAINFSNFRKEFKELDLLKPVFTENDLKVGKKNLDLNMTKTVLPCDSTRIILTSQVPDRGNYYNAVPLSSFKKKDCFIAGQYPVPGAAVDLIRLLVDHGCSTLVSTTSLADIPSTDEWYNLSTKCVSLLHYQVEIDEVEKFSEHVNHSSMKVKATSKKDWHTVDVYEMRAWDTKDDMSRAVAAILDVVNIVQQNENVDPENKLLILSRDGATGCGVFCAVYNAIQQLQQDEEVDMFTIVRQLQSRRPEMISDINEYMLCCRAVSQFIALEPENVYMNSGEPAEESNDTTENVYANV
uniref:protein-tyrosine-phosphatase n=1 Tax=Crassostrea virginica TaxID=6565 RepID=A0A8B8C8Z5_CRAVI|nr:uncharacterized protein LOC111117327 isoform X1 [Crassostrea virginica]